MKKNGFTLVELLAVIIILGLLSLIVVPTVTNSIKNYRNELYEVQKSNIEDAARVWASDNLEQLPTQSGETKKLTLKFLQDEGLVEEDIKDPRNKKKFDVDSTTVTITKNGNAYTYTVELVTEQ